MGELRTESESARPGFRLAPLIRLADGDQPWALPWPCVYEFLRDTLDADFARFPGLRIRNPFSA